MELLVRWLVAFVLVAATFNPTPWNYVAWAERSWSAQMPLVVLLGLVLLLAYGIYLRATVRSIGPVGMVLVAALVAALGWVLVDWGLLSLANPTLNTWLAILALSFVLGVGLSWSIIRRRLSGQADVDDVEDVGR